MEMPVWRNLSTAYLELSFNQQMLLETPIWGNKTQQTNGSALYVDLASTGKKILGLASNLSALHVKMQIVSNVPITLSVVDAKMG